MRTPPIRPSLLAAILVAALALALGACGGSDDGDATVAVTDAWARATAPSQEMGALYAEITGGPEADRLVNVEVAARVAADAQIHETVMADGSMDHGDDAMADHMDGAMTMREVDGIDIPADATVALKPGGYHVMLMGLKKPLAVGDVFDTTFVFEKAGAINVSVTVRES